jgi:DNA topoisomerase-1
MRTYSTYASDSNAHIQATGRDAAGRLQYRYHPDWQKVREIRKARRISRLAAVMPQIRRSIGRHLAAGDASRAFTLSAVIELVARSAIRPGAEEYARLRGTRGAATLLKSNVTATERRFTYVSGPKAESELRRKFTHPDSRLRLLCSTSYLADACFNTGQRTVRSDK